MNKRSLYHFIFVAFIGLFSLAPSSQAKAACALELDMDTVITTAVLDYTERAFELVEERGCSALIIKINTPGGDLNATRQIVTLIMESQVPVLCVIAPRGGRAGSAGAIIMQACHVNGALKATNIGAATPIMGSGQDIGQEDLKKKIINDTVSWLEGVTKERARNLDFSRKIITEAQSLSSDEAFAQGAIDIYTDTYKEFLDLSKDRKIKLNQKLHQVDFDELIHIDQDMRFKILNLIADPQFSYLIFMGSLALIYFEITNPGTMVAGVVGGMGLVFSLISFQKLEVEWGGLALILLGIVFLVAEIFVPSFGVLGVGGIIAVTVGSFFLFDPSTGYRLPYTTIFGTSGLLLLLMLVIGGLVYKASKAKKWGAYEGFIHKRVEVIFVDSMNPNRGEALVNGERWKVIADQNLVLEDKVEIVEIEKLTLKVRKV